MRTSFSCLVLVFAQPIFGWGDVGHRTVGYLAQKFFTDDASKWVDDLLVNDKGFDVGDGATFADSVKFKRPWTKPWHYIDALDQPFKKKCNVDFSRDCGEEGCIVSAITNMTSIVLDTSQEKLDRSEALMFILHFIGDLHQPLHTDNESRGGNEIHICFDSRCSKENLHAIWDTDIIHKLRGLKHTEKYNEERAAAKAFADDLAAGLGTRDQVLKIMEGECDNVQDPESCAMIWAKETNKLNCQYVLKNGLDWLESNNLGAAYYTGAVPIVEAQLQKAGVRLAGWVNAMHAAVTAAEGIVVQNNNVEL